MDGQRYEGFFLRPTDTWHRRYEALRLVFVERQRLSDVADRFAVSYGTVRNWISHFRRQYDRGQAPPFSRSRPAGVLRAGARRRIARRSRLPMPERCRSRRGVGCGPVRRGCSCFGPCWPGCGSTAWSMRRSIRDRR